jgi:outer membrane protein OmpA-like peptidoglycan-associated protein
MTFTVPVGAELNFNVARKLDIYVDYTFTWAGNDKLDQVEKVFYDKDAGKRVIEGIEVINDMYSHVNLGLRYKFNKKTCDIETMAANADQITMRTNPEPLEEKDGKVCFDVIFTVPGEYFEKEAVMNITPTFAYKGGQVVLDPVTFVGQDVNNSQADFKVNYKNGGEFTKHYCTDFVPEMENGKLMGNPMFYVYNGNIYNTQDEIAKNTYFTRGGDRVITNGVLVPVVKCEVSNIKTSVNDNNVTVSWDGDAETYDIYFGEGTPSQPTVEGVKVNTFTFNGVEPGNYNVYVKANCDKGNLGEWQQGTTAEIIAPREPIAIFYFDYESANLKKNAAMNKIALKAIAEKLAAGEAITGFEIEGWASPENGDGNNNKLSADRAKTVEAAIKEQLKKVKLNEKDFTFDATGFGSDWNLFNELVQNSNIKDKDQILRVINNAGANKEREIQNMKNVYNELERDILPLIRRAEVYVK